VIEPTKLEEQDQQETIRETLATEPEG
jgi:hypothetical protein